MPDPTSTPKAIRPPSLHEEVASRLRTLIFDRRLDPGSWIDELALAREWSISRTPLREALKVLAVEGLVTAHPGRGCHVAEMSEDDAAQLFPVMALLEGRCALEAVQRASDTDLRGLQVLHDELERHAAAARHRRLLPRQPCLPLARAGAGRQSLARSRDQELRKFMRLLRGRQLNWPGRMAASIDEHRALMQAIAPRRQAASTSMHDHLMAQLAALQALRAQEQLDARHAPTPAAFTPGSTAIDRTAARCPRPTEDRRCSVCPACNVHPVARSARFAAELRRACAHGSSNASCAAAIGCCPSAAKPTASPSPRSARRSVPTGAGALARVFPAYSTSDFAPDPQRVLAARRALRGRAERRRT